MSLYLDTSCLLKLFFPEPESARVAELIAAETQVLVSTLARLEALVQISGRLEGGVLTKRAATALAARLEALLKLAPYELVATPAGIDALAERQLMPLGSKVHCRTMDRLHLATMEALSVRRLLTNDDIQASAARDNGFDVLLPRS